MPLALRGWLSAAYRRWSPKRMDVWQTRNELIRRLAPGRSFLDFGGMWSVHGDVALLAEEAGAERVVLADMMEPTPEFEAKRRERESKVEYVSAELGRPDSTDGLGPFDVVWCTGVLYHTPDPVGQVKHLRELTAGQLVLGSIVVPEIPGIPQASIFFPALPAPARLAFARAFGMSEKPRVGLESSFERDPEAWPVNYWWGLSPSAMCAVLEVSSFEVTERYRLAPFMLDVVARPVGH